MASVAFPKVLVVDGDTVARRGIIALLDESRRWKVSAETGSAPLAIELAVKHGPALAIVDPERVAGDGLALLRDLQAHAPGVQLVILTHAHDRQSIRRAFANGAHGYALKTDPEAMLLATLSEVGAGRLSASPSITRIVLELLAERPVATHGAGGEPEARLTDRELTVYRLMGRGLNTQQIAAELVLSRKTIETHYARIGERLKVHGLPALRQRAAVYCAAAAA